MIVALLAAVACFVAVSAVMLVFFSSSDSETVERRLRDISKRREVSDVGDVLIREETFPFLKRILSAGTWADSAAIDLRQAGLSLKVTEYLLLRLVATVGLGALVLLIASGSALGPLFAIVAGVAGFLLPALVLQTLKSRRQIAIERQLAPSLALIANALRSGFAFSQAVELAAKQTEAPFGNELNLYLRDTGLGAPSDVALQNIADRVGSYDVEMMVTTILIQRSTGGNLSEILDTVAETIRERERLQGEIRALTASQRFTGLVLSIYPVFLGVIFALLAPDLWSVLWEEEAGRVLLGIAITLQLMGMFSIRRILKLEV